MIGWAYSGNERERARKCRERYEELKSMSGWTISYSGGGYAHANYVGTCPEGVDTNDVVLYCDSGNACFGGSADIKPDRSFTCKVYTD